MKLFAAASVILLSYSCGQLHVSSGLAQDDVPASETTVSETPNPASEETISPALEERESTVLDITTKKHYRELHQTILVTPDSVRLAASNASRRAKRSDSGHAILNAERALITMRDGNLRVDVKRTRAEWNEINHIAEKAVIHGATVGIRSKALEVLLTSDEAGMQIGLYLLAERMHYMRTGKSVVNGPTDYADSTEALVRVGKRALEPRRTFMKEIIEQELKRLKSDRLAANARLENEYYAIWFSLQ